METSWKFAICKILPCVYCTTRILWYLLSVVLQQQTFQNPMEQQKLFWFFLSISVHTKKKYIMISTWWPNKNCFKKFKFDKIKSTLISSSGSEEQNKFPVRIYGHCSFPFNATHGIVTGGKQDGSTSPNTWFVDLTTTTVSPGPTMKIGKRSYHGCSKFQHGTKSFGVVAGGVGNVDPKSTEMINLDQESPEWIEGMQDISKIVYILLNK